MFQVGWLQTALDELAAIWLRADTATRQSITAATYAVDQELQTDPQGRGESRPDDERVFYVYPLGVLFEVDEQRSLVRVLHVWDIRRKR